MDEKKRELFLTIWLILLIVVNVIVAIYALIESYRISIFMPETPAWIAATKGFLSLLNLVAIWGIWNWKKWGLYLIGISVAIIFFINLIIGIPWTTSILGFGGMVILILLVRPQWKFF